MVAFLRSDGGDASSVDAGPVIAVLTFANQTGDPEKEYLGQAIAAGLASELGEIRALRLVSSGMLGAERDAALPKARGARRRRSSSKATCGPPSEDRLQDLGSGHRCAQRPGAVVATVRRRSRGAARARGTDGAWPRRLSRRYRSPGASAARLGEGATASLEAMRLYAQGLLLLEGPAGGPGSRASHPCVRVGGRARPPVRSGARAPEPGAVDRRTRARATRRCWIRRGRPRSAPPRSTPSCRRLSSRWRWSRVPAAAPPATSTSRRSWPAILARRRRIASWASSTSGRGGSIAPSAPFARRRWRIRTTGSVGTGSACSCSSTATSTRRGARTSGRSTLAPPGVTRPRENLAALEIQGSRFDEAIRLLEEIPRGSGDGFTANYARQRVLLLESARQVGEGGEALPGGGRARPEALGVSRQPGRPVRRGRAKSTTR